MKRIILLTFAIPLGSFDVQSEGVGPECSYIHNHGMGQLAFEAKWLPQTQVETSRRAFDLGQTRHLVLTGI